MPLHLLGKKSWNVYNQDNIERVRRDEADARSAEQEAERRRKADDAAERLSLLRGQQAQAQEPNSPPRHVSKRKRSFEDTATQELPDDARIVKHSRRGMDDIREPRGDAQTSKIQDPLDQISNMRFRDALGKNGHREPWYSNITPNDPGSSVRTDVWGNEDAGRQVRDQNRLDATDPLLAMKKGVKQLKDSDRMRAEWRKEREKDLYEVEELARRERHRRRREERHKDERDKDRSKRDYKRRHHHGRVGDDDDDHRHRAGKRHEKDKT